MEYASIRQKSLSERRAMVATARFKLLQRAEKAANMVKSIKDARAARKPTERVEEMLNSLSLDAVTLVMETDAVEEMIRAHNDVAILAGREYRVDGLPSSVMSVGSKCHSFATRTEHEMRIGR
ncbi:MAG TPA: hypothetical protein VNT79_09960 [Phycisphaerae bacterium]|nr:hypothetical protein [Phycisphaerae bacterium]